MHPKPVGSELDLLGKSLAMALIVLMNRFFAWIVWRSFYATTTLGWRNKLLVPMYWTLAFLFGRDVTRF
jgi:NADH dehydrogenase FAD-containing subunit